MKFFRSVFFVSLILITNSLSAQKEDNKKLVFSFDYASFRAQQNMVYLETYFSISRSYLEYVKENDRFKAEFSVNVKFLHGDSLVIEQSWRNVDYIDSLGIIKEGQKLLSMNHFQLEPQDYELDVKLEDLNSQNFENREFIVTLPAFPTSDLCMSDIVFATQIKATTEKTQFYKNGYNVIPNTERFYGTGLPMLMAYSEIYNLLRPGEQANSEYEVTYSILNSDEDLVREFPPKTKLKPGYSAVEIGGLNIVTFTSGTYYLQISVDDSVNNRKITRRSKFFVFRPGDFAKIQKQDSLAQLQIDERAIRLIQGYYQSMTEEEMDAEFDAASYIATSEEKEIYKTLDVSGKRQFMPQFWTKRDNSPQTARNEFRDDYLMKVRTAEKEFRGFKKGWKSDEGRVLLVYGAPDEIERFPSSNENKAYRIWRFFSIQGGVEFVFVDKRGWGEYELVHSNARGELFDQSWTRWIQPN